MYIGEAGALEEASSLPSIGDGSPTGLARGLIYPRPAVVSRLPMRITIFGVGPLRAAPDAVQSPEALLLRDLDLAASAAIDLGAADRDARPATGDLDGDILIFGRRDAAGGACGGRLSVI